MSKTQLTAKDFVHLHNHTQYSLLDGLTKIPDLVEHVDSYGMQAVAITDHGTLSGAVEFYKEAKNKGIKPIIGIETYVAARKNTDKDPSKDKANYHLIVLAMNNTGYQNLLKLSTIANLEGFYYRPRIDHSLLKKYSEGLIVLSGCIGGEVGDALRRDQYELAKKTAEWYKSVFGDRYYFEIQDHGHKDHPSKWDEQVEVTEKTIKLAKELDVNCVITSDAHYLRKSDQEAHEILLCVQTGSFLSDENRMSLKEFELFVSDPKDIIKRWGDKLPEAIKNTRAIADRCNVELSLGNILIPKFDVPKGETEKSYLEKLVYRGLAWRYGGINEEKADNLTIPEVKKVISKNVDARATYELEVILQMGFAGYFLIISDFINWGKDKGIVFGPGRGSAAGSIISYALKITELDPLKYDLLFERFLNPDRISMPDIDIDIQDSRRDEVINYCIEKYGDNRVANIVTFGRMAARNAVRDVSRVLQVPYAEADRLAKMIPPPVQGRHIPLKISLKDNKELKEEYKNNKTAKEVFDLAIQLEGTIRSHGVHAAGVVIAPDDIVKFVPLEMAQKGVVATQYSMGPVDELGLLKIDFLGLSNLTIIKNALRIIRKVEGADINLADLPLDDKATFKLLCEGDTTGVFQLESSGMKRYLKELKPTAFDDIIAMVSLYRPGPLTAGLTQKFINRKNGVEPISYDHETMENALKSTYGVLVYQEQVMQIAKDMCGFTGGESDTLRKAVGKKIRSMMVKMKDKIINGAIENGVDKQIAEKFWHDLEGFADYAFNKSHAACYAMIAYWTAYLKAHYPAAFMASLMTSDFDNSDRLAIEIAECGHLGIEVLPPDVNESFVEFAVVPGNNQIRFGMSAIKNVGTGAVEEILRARQEGNFTSIEDFMTRVNTRIVNRKAMESLIKSGAFDRFNERGILFINLDIILAYANRQQKLAESGQTDLFGSLSEDLAAKPSLILENAHNFKPGEVLAWERELLGIYLSKHPLSDYEDMLSKIAVPISDIKPEHNEKRVKIGGAIMDMREITTKNGKKMAFVKLADKFGEIELVVFPGVFEKVSSYLGRDKVVLANGKVSSRDSRGNVSLEVKILADEIRELSPDDRLDNLAPSKMSLAATSSQTLIAAEPKLYIRLEDSSNQDLLLDIKTAIDAEAGATDVVLVLGDEHDKQVIKLPLGINPSETSLNKLKALIGPDKVKLH